MSRYDVRAHPSYKDAIRKLGMRARPLVGPVELEELSAVIDALPHLHFPISSASELLDQLGRGRSLEVLGMRVDPARMIKYMPAYYFPIASFDNFVEKMAELLRANRRDFDSIKYRDKIREKMKGANFPLQGREDLEKALQGIAEFSIAGRRMDLQRALRELPEHFFPVEDADDLERKAMGVLARRRLIEAD